MNGILYIAATPIGNLEDITFRAVRVLQEADFIIAEDTRTTMKLLERYNIYKKIVSCHKFNEKARLNLILNELLSGKNAVLVSDAGTPCISDPGHILVLQAVADGIPVIPIPGPSAVSAGLSVSGFELKNFAFYGFLPRDASGIKKLLESVKKDSQNVAVFYESPKRIIKTLEIISITFPNAELCLCNDLSKKFERIYRGDIDSVIGELRDNPDCEKGEYTLIMQKNRINGESAEPDADISDISIEAMLFDKIIKNNCTMKDAVGILYSEKKGLLKKNDIYAASLKLSSSISQLGP